MQKPTPNATKTRYIIDREKAKDRDRAERMSSAILMRQQMQFHQRILFSYKNKWIPIWDFLIIFLALINCLMVPLEIAIELQYMNHYLYDVVNAAFDLLFFIDMLVSFNTTLLINNEEIKDRAVITRRYLVGQFTIDFLSAFPVDLVANVFFKDLSSKQLKVISLLKLMRMLRLSRIVRALQTSRDIKAQMQLVILVTKLLIYLHCSACLQLYIIQYESLWDHPIYSNYQGWGSKFYEDTTEHQYIVCFLNAMIINKGKNAFPMTTLHTIVDLFSTLLGIAIYGHVLGSFKEVKFEMAELSFLFQKISNSLAAALLQLSISDRVAEQASAYIKLISTINFYSQTVEDFFVIVSPSLVNKVNEELLLSSIRNTTEDLTLKSTGIFSFTGSMKSTIFEEISEMSRLIHLMDYTVEKTVCQASDEGKGFFILLKGELDIFVKGAKYKFCKTTKAKTSGQVLGEISFLFKTRRTATIVAATNCKMFFLDKRHNNEFHDKCPTLLRRLTMQAYSYKDACIQEKKRLIRNSVHYFKKAEEKAIIELAFQTEVKYLSQGQVVFNQFQRMQKLILVQDGTLLLTLPSATDSVIFERLNQGSSLGQYSLLRKNDDSNQGRIFFKVHSLRATTICLITKELLTQVQDKYPDLNREIQDCSTWAEFNEIPQCDFQIDYDLLKKVKEHAQEAHRQRTYHKSIVAEVSLKSKKLRQPKKEEPKKELPKKDTKIGKKEEAKDKIYRIDRYEGDEDLGVQVNSEDEIDLAVQNLENILSEEDQMSDSSMSIDSKFLHNSSQGSSQDIWGPGCVKVKALTQDRTKLLFYAKKLTRAVRRQIMYNIYKGKLGKQMNLYQQMILMQRTKMSDSEKPYYLRESSLCQINVDAKLMDRLEDGGSVLSGFERCRRALSTNEAHINLIMEPIRLQTMETFNMRQKILNKLEKELKRCRVSILTRNALLDQMQSYSDFRNKKERQAILEQRMKAIEEDENDVEEPEKLNKVDQKIAKELNSHFQSNNFTYD